MNLKCCCLNKNGGCCLWISNISICVYLNSFYQNKKFCLNCGDGGLGFSVYKRRWTINSKHIKLGIFQSIYRDLFGTFSRFNILFGRLIFAFSRLKYHFENYIFFVRLISSFWDLFSIYSRVIDIVVDIFFFIQLFGYICLFIVNNTHRRKSEIKMCICLFNICFFGTFIF